MIRLPLGSSKELLARLERAPHLTIAPEEAFRALAADVVALQNENTALRETASRLIAEMTLLRNELKRYR